MKKRLFALLLAAALLVTPVTSAYADSLTGGDNWYVCFDDKDNTTLSSNFTGSDISKLAGEMQPGDDITFSIKVQNTEPSKTTVDYYLRNDILQSFETSEAKGAIYTYKLYYTTSDGTVKTYYSNGAVGGDASTGLMGVDTSLEDFFFLDELKYNEEGVLTLQIALDGETQRNDYQDTMAEVLLQFQVEIPDKSTDSTTTNRTTNKVYKTDYVLTGDSMRILILSGIAAAAGILILIIAIILVKRNKDEEAENPKA